MPSAAEKFLRQKREQAMRSSNMDINTIAPSAAKRYGMKDDMGGYNMKSGSYTGKGPDNVTQRQNPTQRRMDSNGKPYFVDENEVVVIDSETLNDFGGPEALNQFIQQNRPSRQPGPQVPQQPMGQPTPMQPGPQQMFRGGVTQPMANGMQQGTGFRQYACGGVPTRNRGVMSPEQVGMLQEIKTGMDQFQEGGTPTSRDRSIIPGKDPKPIGPGGGLDIPGGGFGPGGTGPGGGTIPGGTPGGGMIPGKSPVPSPYGKNKGPNIAQTAEQIKLNKKKNMAHPNPIPDPIPNPTDPIQAPDLGIQNTENINLTDIANPVDPVVGPITQGPDLGIQNTENINLADIANPVQPVIDPIQQPTDPVETKAPAYSGSNLDEMLWNRYNTRLGAQMEAQRAGEAQRGFQAGMSDREVAGRGAIGDVGRREAMSSATSEFAIDAAKRAAGQVSKPVGERHGRNRCWNGDEYTAAQPWRNCGCGNTSYR